MKILHVIDSGGIYGAEIVLLNLVAEQMRMGVEPVIASIGEKSILEKPLESEAIKRGFKVVKFRMVPGPNPIGLFKILRFAQTERFDILHSHGYKGDVAFGLMPKRLRKIPLVSTLHGWISTKKISKNGIYEWLQWLSFRYIDAVVLVSRGMLSNPRLKNLKHVKFHIVNNGIPPIHEPFSSFIETSYPKLPLFESSNALDRNIFDFCTRGYTIGSIGRLSPEKGFAFLLHAIKKVSQIYPDIRLIIIGEGEERKRLENLVFRLGLSEKVILPGYRYQAKDYLRLFQILVLPSLTEGLPMALLEGMQAGVPIIATNVGGIPEILEDGKTGLLVESGSSDSLTKAILRIRQNLSLREKLIILARQHVQEKYSSQKMANGYLKIYQGLTNAH